MKIKIANRIIETEFIYCIEPVCNDYWGVGFNVCIFNADKPLCFYFTIKDNEIKFKCSTPDEIKKERERLIDELTVKVEAMRDKLVEFWKGNQFRMPEIEL